ncbi:MAG: DNA recombination protein RmuC [Planctomycetota bacterium]|nr:DNA recombination protein RmuC [Planctomycetota bacterium]
MDALFPMIGVVVGALGMWLVMRGKAVDVAAAAANAVSTTETATADKLKLEINNSFKAMAADVLNANSKQFSDKTELQLQPLKEQLDKLAKETRTLEETRQQSRGQLSEQLNKLQLATTSLQMKSESLSTALRGSSQARGQWGETVLERILELAGMTKDIHFTVQRSVGDGLRPDFQILLPGGDVIPVDSKVPMAAYLDAQKEEDATVRSQLLKRHTADVMKHVKDLAKKDYAKDVAGEIDFTVMFLPGDHLLSATFEHDQHLQEKAMEARVLIATPVTMMALLRTVDLYWQQEKIAKNAVEIADTAKEYHERMKVFTEHMNKVGKGLKSSVDSYNKAIGSYNKKVLPQGRRVEQLSAASSAKQLEEPKSLELNVREDVESD